MNGSIFKIQLYLTGRPNVVKMNVWRSVPYEVSLREPQESNLWRLLLILIVKNVVNRLKFDCAKFKKISQQSN